MGHERVGILPKSQRWRSIVEQMGAGANTEAEVSDIAAQTLQAVRERFRALQHDEGTKAAFRFLLAVAVASRPGSPEGSVADLIGPTSTPPTPLQLARALKLATANVPGSPEYKAIVEGAAADALAAWYTQHRPQQKSLLDSFPEAEAVWSQAGTGAGFCEISRLFFSRCTERYLRYFLEREASSAIPNVGERDRFERELSSHVEKVSQHAFETAKITQSFAAGWFNLHAREGMPSEREIEGFLSHAFGKLRDELAREGRDG
jgi:hypothetical protein